ncbi:MAG: sulfotransferase [Thermoplasmatota archaeon]
MILIHFNIRLKTIIIKCCFSIKTMSFIDLHKKSLFVTKEPLAGADIRTLLSLLKQNKFHVSVPYLPRLFYSFLLSGILSPFRYRDRKSMKKIKDKNIIKHPPLFLLGHWRGGTTYLHNMLSKDSQFGFFSTFDAYAPGIFLKNEQLLKGIVAGSLPKKRPMDDVVMGADLPQEDEYALGGMSVYSYYHGWCFPKNMGLYDRYVWLDDVSESVKDDFKKTYLYLLNKATIKNNGRCLLLKNPSNTARIKLLLEMFPDAKFVHIHRNPYHQFLSMSRFMKIVIPLYCLQTPPSFDEVEEHLLGMYEHMYRAYLAERKLVPKDHLIGRARYERDAHANLQNKWK